MSRCVFVNVCVRLCLLFFFFFSLSLSLCLSCAVSFPSKGFFVATFCMRSILFAGSNREKKIASFLFSPPTQQEVSFLSSLSFSFFLHNNRRERESKRASKRKVSFALSFSRSLPLLLPERVYDTCM